MKTTTSKFLMALVGMFMWFNSSAQLPDGSTAPDFNVTDINGNPVHLYSILNSGKPVIMDISATWCGPCWSYHQGHALKDLYNQYGPPGTDELMVLFVEGDNSTGTAELNGSGNTAGDWVTGTPYPIIDNGQIANDYQIAFYPTVYLICPDKKTKNVGTLSAAQLYAEASACPAITVDAQFTASNTTINEGQSVTFTDQSTGNPTSWNWSFTGGTPNSSTTQNPTITYNTAGTYEVSLTASNGANSDTETKTAYITVVGSGAPPVANFVASSTSVAPGGSVNFTDQSAGNPTSWSWTFTGGTPSSSTDQNPTNITYPTAGTYEVSMTATNGNGSDTETKTAYITVAVPDPCAAGATNTSYEQISNVTFGSINNTSTTQNGGYADYRAMSTDIVAGGSENITVTISNPYNSDQIIIWADWNRDGDFDDAGESLHTSATGTGPFSTSITVPGGTSPGPAVMRIRLHDTGNGPNATACGNSTYGEVEDYTINVTAPASTDATLSNLTSNGTQVPNFSSSTYTYNIELPYGTTTVPTAVGTPNDANATVVVNAAGSVPGTNTVVVTAEDGTTTQTYTINYTVAGKSIQILDGTSDVSNGSITVNGFSSDADVAAHATVKNVGNATIGIKVSKTVDAELTGGTNAFCWVQCFLPSTMVSPNSISFTPGHTDPTNWSGHCYPNGNSGTTTVTYTFYDENNPVDETKLTVNYVIAQQANNDASLSNLTSSGSQVPNFSSSTYTYNIELPFGTTVVPTVVATPTDGSVTVNITYATGLPGTTTIVVTAADGTTTQTYTINYTVASRSINLLDGNGADITDGTITVNGLSTDSDVAAHATVKNVSNSTIGIKVSKTVNAELTGGTNAFCWVQCFLPSTMVSPNSISFAPGQTDPTNWSGHCYPNGGTGTTTVTYTFYDENNPSDASTLTVNYVIGSTPNNDATLSNLTVDGTTVTGFNPQTLTYTVTVTGSTVPTVVGTPNDPNATISQTDATAIPGTTTIVVTAEDGVTQLTYVVNFEATVGLTEAQGNTLNAFPNPVSDVLTISGLEEGSEVAVFDLSGKLVSQMRSMNEIERLDVNAFENGIYYIRVTNGTQIQSVKITVLK